MIFYYSGCGNSRFIAENIAKALNDRLLFVPEAARAGQYRYDLAEGERIGFVFPIYSWRPPQLVLDFVSKLAVDNHSYPMYVWMAATCGDNVGYADEVFQQQLEEAGLPLHASFCFVMPNTYVNMSGMSTDKPEVAQHKIEETRTLLPNVIRDITERRSEFDMRRGSFPHFKTNVIGKGFNKWISDEPFHVTDSCISCGKCVSVCPLQNIILEKGRPRWQGHCTNCEACFHYCPQNAIQFGKATKGKAQYYFGKPW